MRRNGKIEFTMGLVLAVLLSAPCAIAAPDVPFSEEYNGIWQGTLPVSCVNGRRAKKSERKRLSTLKLCVEDNENGANRELTGSARNKVSLRGVQSNGKIKSFGKRVRITDSVTLSSKDPSESAYLYLKGKGRFRNRIGNMAVVIADEKDSAVADPGDLVATFGDCVSIVYKFVRANAKCE